MEQADVADGLAALLQAAARLLLLLRQLRLLQWQQAGAFRATQLLGP